MILHPLSNSRTNDLAGTSDPIGAPTVGRLIRYQILCLYYKIYISQETKNFLNYYLWVQKCTHVVRALNLLALINQSENIVQNE